MFVGEKCSVKRRELWKTIDITADTNAVEQTAFKSGNFPPWFDKISSCYEHYSIKNLKLILSSPYGKMVSGSAVLSYNTVYGDTFAQDRGKLLSQQGAKEFKVADFEIIVTLPKSALSATPSKKTCRAGGSGTNSLDTSYAFDARYFINASQGGKMYLYVEYDVDFYTPQLN